MKLAILSDLFPLNAAIPPITNNNRSAGAHHIRDIAESKGHDAICIDYWTHWPTDKLVEALLSWFGDSVSVIGYGGAINSMSLSQFKTLTDELRERIPTLRVILGGLKTVEGDPSWVTAAFNGRSAAIFAKWLDGDDIECYRIPGDFPVYQPRTGELLEVPVVSHLRHDDFWMPEETPTVELQIGCKFNCTFCGYDYKNIKKPVLADEDNLYKYLQDAYDNFGISYFVLADDTLNESDSKLEMLCRVVSKLSFTPSFSAFVRVDLLGSRPHQIDLLKRAGVRSMFFGIESLTPAASKLVKKGGPNNHIVNTLMLLKQEFPEAFTYGNFIMGITYDNWESIQESSDYIIQNKLLSSADCNPLFIYSEYPESDFDKTPEKYGYIITDRVDDPLKTCRGLSVPSKWTNDWTDSEEAKILAGKLGEKYREGLGNSYSSFGQFFLEAAYPGMSKEFYADNYELISQKHIRNIRLYVNKKYEYIVGGNGAN